MRIGLFTDTYRPSVNGIVYVVESLKEQLEAFGHEVYIFCPGKSLLPEKQISFVAEDKNILRFPSIKSGFFDEFNISLFFPKFVVDEIGEMQLDVIHVFTPSQIGLLGINAALKHDIPLIIQHCTDIYEFVEHYPAVLPGALALIGLVLPMSVRLDLKDIREIIKLYRPQSGVTKWNKKIIEKTIAMLYSRADVVIAQCEKSYRQLASWQDDTYNFPLELMPNGVDALPLSSQKERRDFKEHWGIDDKDEVFGFVGRLGEEKNLPILIKAFDHIGKSRPKAKLVFVGDFDFRKKLEEMAAQSKFPNRIIFTGKIPREKLHAAYANFDVFAFPSLKDTQGWVLHEAAHTKLPIVLIDKYVSEITYDGVNALFANNNATDFARKVIDLLGNRSKRQSFGDESKRLAAKFTSRRQTHKLETLYRKTIRSHSSQNKVASDGIENRERIIIRSIKKIFKQMSAIAIKYQNK